MGKQLNKGKKKIASLVITMLLLNVFVFIAPASYAAESISSVTIQYNDTWYSPSGSTFTFERLNNNNLVLKASFSGLTGSYQYKLIIDNTEITTDLSNSQFTFNLSSFVNYNSTHSITVKLLNDQGTEVASKAYTLVLGPEDTTAPQVVSGSCSPQNNATGVEVDATISIRFSEEIDSSTVKAANFTISPSVSLTPSLNSDKKTVTLQHSSNLAYNTAYTITVKAGGIKDLAGNAVSSATTLSFTTKPDPAAAPTIESRSPASGASNVAVDTNIVISLSKELDVSSVTSGSITLKQGSTVIPVTIVPVNSGGKGKITIDPISNLSNYLTYTVTIASNTIKDTNGKYLSGTSWSFTTEQGALPVITSRYPAVNDDDIPVDAKITIKFSKAMNSSTITTSTVYLRKSGSSSNISCTISYSSSSRTVTLKPNADLALNTTYYVYVSSSVKDTEGKSLSSSTTSWKFTTVDEDYVQVLSKSPAPDATDVPVDTKITFKFSAPMYASSITKSNIYLKRSGYSSTVGADVSYNSSTRTVTITPNSDLRFDTEYTVYVTDDVKDADKNYITQVEWSFTTMDEDYLRIVERDPEPDEDNVPVDTAITIKFSKAMKSSTVTTSNIYLRKSGSSSKVPASISYSSSKKTATLKPDSPLSGNTEYTVYVTSSVKDADNVSIASTSWEFATKAAPATVIYKDPASNASRVEVNKTIFFGFSKAVQSSSVTSSSVYLKKYGTSSVIPATVNYNSSTYTVSLDPKAALDYNTTYTVYVSALVKDTDGAGVTPVSWSFVTEAEPEKTGLPDRPLVKVDGKYINFTDMYPSIKNGRTMIPFRALFEALDAEVGYDASNAKKPKVTGKLGNNTVVIYIGQLTAYRNNVAYTLDVPAEIINGRTMIPLRFAGESLGAKVNYDSKTCTVIIESN